MEEKKVAKISLSTFFLILSLIVIIVMGIFMYKFYIEKTEATRESSDLQTQVNSSTEIVNDLQGKIDNISTTINSNNSTENTASTNTNNSTSFTDEQIKTALSNYLELSANLHCNSLLDCLKEKGELNYKYNPSNYLSDGRYRTNIKYSDYRNAMLKYVSKSEFERNWNSYYSEDSNGNLIAGDGGGDLRVYTIKSITKTNDSTYSAKTTSVVLNDEYFEEENFTFVVTSYNGNCIIVSIK